MARSIRASLFACVLAAATALPALCPADAGEGAFDPAPWIEDLRQIRAAMTQKYANFEWLVFERRMPLAGLFDATERRLRGASSDEEARQTITLALRSIGDGHLGVIWPRNPSEVPAAAAAPLCTRLRYEATLRGEPMGPRIPGYRPLRGRQAAEFPAGTIRSGTQQIGVLRLGVFVPQGYPELCESARHQLGIEDHDACDDRCADRIETAAYELMSHDLALRIRELARRGSSVLMMDISSNGGGSEWAEAAARIVSPVKLSSARRMAVRGEHWVAYWTSLAADLREAERSAAPGDAGRLENWAQQVDQARAEANTPCSAEPFWSGVRPGCAWLAPAFYATGILAAADAGQLHRKPWGVLVFSIAQYAFEESAWHGPVLVLVDERTASAAEEFAAVLQDNRAAVVIGTRTAGVGCGHTHGGTPTTLTHSRGILVLPDCARLRLDDSNEVRGIDPDVPVGLQSMEGVQDAGRWVGESLPRAVDASVRLCDQAHCRRTPAGSTARLSSTPAP
jgi:hypothetical protein